MAKFWGKGTEKGLIGQVGTQDKQADHGLLSWRS